MKIKLLSLVLAVLMLAAAFAVMTLPTSAGQAVNSAILDLDESSSTYPISHAQNGYYSLGQEGDTVYNDVTKVKVEWVLPTLAVTYESEKTWDPETLSWTEEKTVNDLDSERTDATFTVTNYSSVPVHAGVVFEVEDDLVETFNKITFTNNDCTVGTVVGDDGEPDETRDHDEVITAVISVNKDAFAELSDTEKSKYGTYTVSIASLTEAAGVAKTTVNENQTVSLEADKTPADTDGNKTKVEIPTGTQNFAVGKVAELTVETKTAAEASADSAFNVATGVNAVGAISLTVKANGTAVTAFKDANGDAVAVKVTTYIAKGLTNVTLKYLGEGDDPTDVTYESATGKLTFKTTHFSTFSVGADQKCILASNNTAYDSLTDAIAAASATDTVTMLKNEAFTGTVTLAKEGGETFTIDLGGKTLSWAEKTDAADYDCIAVNGAQKFVIKNGSLVNTAGSYGCVIDGGEEVGATQILLEDLTVSHTDNTANMHWGALCCENDDTVIRNCTFTSNTVGLQIADGEALIVGTTVNAMTSAFYLSGGSVVTLENCETAGAKRAIHACTSGATVTVNGGTYSATEYVIQLDNNNPNAVDWQGVPNYVGGSYCIVNAGDFTGAIKYSLAGENAIAQLYVNGGNFTADVSGYPTYDGN